MCDSLIELRKISLDRGGRVHTGSILDRHELSEKLYIHIALFLTGLCVSKHRLFRCAVLHSRLMQALGTVTWVLKLGSTFTAYAISSVSIVG